MRATTPGLWGCFHKFGDFLQGFGTPLKGFRVPFGLIQGRRGVDMITGAAGTIYGCFYAFEGPLQGFRAPLKRLEVDIQELYSCCHLCPPI